MERTSLFKGDWHNLPISFFFFAKSSDDRKLVLYSRILSKPRSKAQPVYFLATNALMGFSLYFRAE